MGRKDDACILIDEANFGESRHNHLAGSAVVAHHVYSAEFVEFSTAVALSHDSCVGSSTTGDTTGVERTECELRTWFTDGLCSDDTHSFTLLYHLRGREVATVALHADAMTAFTGENGTDFHFFDACGLNGCCDGFGDFFTTVHEDMSIFGVCDVVN